MHGRTVSTDGFHKNEDSYQLFDFTDKDKLYRVLDKDKDKPLIASIEATAKQ